MKIDIATLKPSELIRVAVADLEAVEKDERYRVDMGVWHVRSDESMEGPCFVCLAGAVMAKSLGAVHGNNLIPIDFGADLAHSLMALNSFRMGFIDEGLHLMGEDMPVGIPSTFPVTPYVHNPTQFKADMQTMATLLEEHGL